MESVTRLSSLEADNNSPILCGAFGQNLKAMMEDAVFRYRILRETENPVFCYIAAWEMGNSEIWYEYADERFVHLFKCSLEELPSVFRERIMERRVFAATPPSGGIHSEIIKKNQLSENREHLRESALHQEASEALYKVSLDKSKIVWLKDQARVKQYPEYSLCISYGSLSFITQEMESYLALVDRETVLRTLFGFSPMPILLADPVTGKILDANETFCQFTGYNRLQILSDLHKKWLLLSDARDPFRFVQTSDTKLESFDVTILTNLNKSIEARMFIQIIPISEQPLLLVGFREKPTLREE